MNKLVFALAGIVFSASVFAQSAGTSATSKAAAPSTASSCEAKAIDKNGKPLAGAAKAAFIKKCEAGNTAKTSSCEAKAVDKNGKPLAGAAKTSFMKKCEAETGK